MNVFSFVKETFHLNMLVKRSLSSTITKTERKKKKPVLVPTKGEILYGFHPVRIALENPNRTIFKVFVKYESTERHDIIDLALSRGIEVQECTRGVLSKLTESSAHNGICIDTLPLKPLSAEKHVSHQEMECSNTEDRLWVLLASIVDPHNMGAIIRSAYFLGAEKIFICSSWDNAQSSCPLTATVARSSAGTLDLFTPLVVHSPETYLDQLDSLGWQIIGAVPGPSQDEKHAVEAWKSPQKNYAKSRILIVGNEGDGIAPSIMGKCHSFISLSPGRPLHPSVDSLNVSVATALLMQKLLDAS